MSPERIRRLSSVDTPLVLTSLGADKDLLWLPEFRPSPTDEHPRRFLIELVKEQMPEIRVRRKASHQETLGQQGGPYLLHGDWSGDESDLSWLW